MGVMRTCLGYFSMSLCHVAALGEVVAVVERRAVRGHAGARKRAPPSCPAIRWTLLPNARSKRLSIALLSGDFVETK
jgi:hypothetical protein